ncbi:HPP family protein [Pseudomonadota bacterium]
MDCKTVMAPIKVKLYADELAGNVIDFMVEKHMGLVPVVERDGTFAGLISGDGLMKFLLPRSLSALGGGVFKRGFTLHKRASYLNESASEMKGRLDAVRDRPIRDMLEHKVKVANPDTPLIDALMMIKDKQYVVPVVDDDKQLVGAISFFSVLYGLYEEYDRETVQKQKIAERKRRKEEKAHDRRVSQRRDEEHPTTKELEEERRRKERRDSPEVVKAAEEGEEL